MDIFKVGVDFWANAVEGGGDVEYADANSFLSSPIGCTRGGGKVAETRTRSA